MKHLFIVNPSAGKGKPLRLIPVIKQFFAANASLLGNDFVIEITQYPGEATEIVRRYVAGAKLRVYSVGGDGTLNEVVNGLIGSDSSLAIIPTGSGNDFVRSLPYDLPIHDLLFCTANGEAEPVDLAVVNGRYFINIASVGFDAEVVYQAQKMKNALMPSHLCYFAGIVRTLCRYNNLRLKVSLDGQVREAKFLLMAIANGKYYGGGILPTPDARIDDGLLDVCLITEKNFLQIVTTLPKYIKGRHREIPGVDFYKVREVKVYSEREFPLNIDGEIVMAREAAFRIIPQGIKLVIPRTAGFISRLQAAATSPNYDG